MISELGPKDRLLRHGAESLSDAELLAVVLRNGRPGQSAVEVARQILSRAGGLANLARADRQTLRSCGASDGRASIILAAAEVIRRLARGKITRKLMSQPAAVAAYVFLRFANEEQEIMGALYLDIRNRLVGERDVFRGCLSRASVEPAPILQDALRHRAASSSSGTATRAATLLPVRRISPSHGAWPRPESFSASGCSTTSFLGSGGRWVSLSRLHGW